MAKPIPELHRTWVEGDEYPELIATLVDVDLTTYTVTFHMKRPDGTILIKPVVGIDLVQGHYKVVWDPTDLIAGKRQLCEFQWVDSGGKPLSSPPFLINVRKQVA